MSCKYRQVGCKSRVLGPGWWQLPHQVWPSCSPNQVFWAFGASPWEVWVFVCRGIGMVAHGFSTVDSCGRGWSVPAGKRAYFPGSAWASLCYLPHSQQHCSRGASWYLGPLSFFQFGSHFCSMVELPLLVPFIIHTFNFSLFMFCVLLWG